MISHQTIEEAAYAIMCKAAIDIPEDYFQAGEEQAKENAHGTEL